MLPDPFLLLPIGHGHNTLWGIQAAEFPVVQQHFAMDGFTDLPGIVADPIKIDLSFHQPLGKGLALVAGAPDHQGTRGVTVQVEEVMEFDVQKIVFGIMDMRPGGPMVIIPPMVQHLRTGYGLEPQFVESEAEVVVLGITIVCKAPAGLEILAVYHPTRGWDGTFLVNF